MLKPIKVGLTGGIGAGKSTVLKFISEKGIPVLQADQVGHGLLDQPKIKIKLINKYGKEIIGRNGKINRGELGKKVFQKPRNQKWLNELLHPAIRKLVALWVKKHQKKYFPILVVEVPLLFEKGYHRRFDGVLSISSPTKKRHKRLEKRGWLPEEIGRRENSQWSQARKNKKANWVIVNRKSLKELKYSVDQWLKTIKRKLKGPGPFHGNQK